MSRYLIRRDSTGDLYMVWDREQRRPATVEDRQLVRLTLAQAEIALAELGGIKQSKEAPSYMTWQVTYGAGTSVPCLHEVDAKLLSRELVIGFSKNIGGPYPSPFY
jgi:hypothetical protein